MTRDFLNSIAEGIVGKVGDAFLQALVSKLRESMEVTMAFITEGLGDPPKRLRARLSWKQGQAHEPFDYDLEGTPCELVYQGQRLIIPDKLWRRFPKDAGYNGYCGIPLRDVGGRVTGHLGVISEQPIGNPERTEGVMRIFAMRAETEMQRMAHEEGQERLISKLKRANRRLAQQHKALREANAFKTELLGMIAHDLRNPLQVMVSRNELVHSQIDRISKEYPGAAVSSIIKSCDVVMKTTERMEKIITSTLKSARADATKFELHKEYIRLRRPVLAAMDMNARAAQNKNIQLSEAVDEKLRAWADEDKLIEALDNLISNAIKYSFNDTEVRIDGGTNQDEMILRVIDQGQGIAANEIEYAFTSFKTLSARPTSDEGSTGLGLAVVRSIMEAHGGMVKALSEGKGKGSTFLLTLPLEIPADSLQTAGE